ncbi:hypothetical protein N7462_005033 [Penicillium macrosclerotiorum]|uniref:uncharacterized protein n=1 Tax=Penicillium macrosclerotiorum TaxID=303699 RepID=UPI0025468492|nr:uncharacterized protein N7462_005033 [Penicillium macrosclerotiorum]KAJ5690641.1 hypothetical protein N7462_005033 [Penicillium macrosclerotiorum]
MTTRKHTEILDLHSSDDEANDRGYDSEENVSKSKGRAVKRRRTADTAQDFFGLSNDDDSEDEEVQDQVTKAGIKGKGRKVPKSDDNDEDEDEDEGLDADGGAYLDVTKTAKPSTKEKKTTKKSGKKLKPGVVYFSSLPPYLKPKALVSLLEKRSFGPITKVFLSPHVPGSSAPRKRNNKRQLFTDGWVQFASKRTAKIAAETLNATTINGPKRGYYRDDLWNMKYLKGYSWDDLTEQIRRETAERTHRMRIEDERSRKEEKVFLAGVEAGRVADGIAKKNEEKRKRKAEAGAEDTLEPKLPAPLRRRFVQNEVVAAKKEGGIVGEDAKRVLGKIF